MKIAPVPSPANNPIPPTPEQLNPEVKDIALKVLQPQEAPRHSELLKTAMASSPKEVEIEFLKMMNYLGGGAF